ncbi:clostripain-related cysteine peptidase [Alistipes timonensis]|uniref:clostripain-related cysteine peptidase n=1 Tax=Alistipes timonensis TaxID=1465754 RepID=UPI001C3D1D58|nr:clostripain-related cysteine peptidase [Alistipes timonensis]MCR2031004.1 clostripain-related cysteine peptidase [Alistipes timonensis]
MMRLLRHTLCLLTLATLAACSKEEPGYNPPARADRTVLLYMPGQSLSAYYKNNIQGIHTAVTDRALGNGRMLVCWQPEKQTSAVMLEIYYDRNKRRSETKTLKTYDDFNAGSSADVQRIFADAAELAPAQNYGLIIGCHGKAWIPASGGVLPYSLRSAEPDDDVWTTAPGAKTTRSFGDTGYELDITELASAIETQSFRFDYLIFDDCFMANIETLYDLRRAVDYIVASPCEVMGDGFPYDRIVPHLFEGNGVLSSLEKACWEFWNLYENDWRSTIAYEQSGCISLAVTAQLDALATEMRRIKDKKQAFDIGALQYYKGNVTKLFYDLEHYVTLCCNDPGIVNDFKARMELAFPVSSRHHTASFYSAYDRRNHSINYYSGVSVSEPEPSAKYAAKNRQTNWYRDTH